MLTVFITIAILITSFYLYISTGSFEISQLTPHNALTKKIISITKHRSIDKRMKEVVVPGNLKDTDLIIAGFKHYEEMCTGCHAAPGVNADEMAKGLYPKPPELFKHVEEDDAQEFFWILKNGIKMTSMPAYGPTHSDDKIWAITAFVTQKLGKMSAADYQSWITKYGEAEEEREMENEEK